MMPRLRNTATGVVVDVGEEAVAQLGAGWEPAEVAATPAEPEPKPKPKPKRAARKKTGPPPPEG